MLSNRREILFLYDVRDSNPNGDPDDQNRPRMDLNDYNIVTDLRLKRTIRDYWITRESENENNKVLVRRKFNDKKGTVLMMEDLVLNELENKIVDGETRSAIRSEIPKKFLDVRSFGLTAPVSNANVSITGPVQFSIGRSLNKPNISTYAITSTVSTNKDAGSGGMGEFHVVDYSLIAFHGIACEYTAKVTKFSDEDLNMVYEGMWNGTKLLNTRSKTNHTPRLILSIVSKEKEFQIGDIDRYFKLENEDVHNSNNVVIIIDEFIHRLNKYKDMIKEIEIKTDDALVFSYNGTKSNNIRDFLNGFNLVEL